LVHCHLVQLPFGPFPFGPLPFGPIAIWSNCQLVSLPLGQLPFGPIATWSDCHLVQLPLGPLLLISIIFKPIFIIASSYIIFKQQRKEKG
jgi:hypothetical protein